jgi:hypothetical protein
MDSDEKFKQMLQTVKQENKSLSQNKSKDMPVLS